MSFLPLGGFQLPFQRRLSTLYNDTKKSSEFVREPQISEDPDLKAMHRKLKVQKNRLVTWGLEWSDASNHPQAPEIDEALSRAGLSELVGSIMSTIKDILAEAEPLWLSTKRRGDEADGHGTAKRAAGEKKSPALVAWDKTRFDDLVKDLTASIDTLYDLSRTRSTAASSLQLPALSRTPASSDNFNAFASTRMQTPQQIDPRTLTIVKSAPTSRPQRVVFLSGQAYSDHAYPSGERSPLLLEHAHFDPIYATTGIMPDMDRFEKLSSGLQTDSHRSPDAWIGLPLLLGYYEDMNRSRLGMLFRYPAHFNPLAVDDGTQQPVNNICTLDELLSRPDFEPTLEAKFRLAHNLSNTVFDMHSRGITHGRLQASTVSFGNFSGTEAGATAGEVDIRRPLVSSFDVFPDSPASPSHAATLYRHPLDPRTTPSSPLASNRDTQTLDLYSLAMLLVSIGLWTKLENLVPARTTPSVPESVLKQLAIRCGTPYMKAVQACWDAVEQELAHPASDDAILSQTQVRASRYLEACSILDKVSGLDDRLGEVEVGTIASGHPSTADGRADGRDTSIAPLRDLQQPVKLSRERQPLPQSSWGQLPALDPRASEGPYPSPSPSPSVEACPSSPFEASPRQSTVSTPMLKKDDAPRPKLRLYPHVALPAEVIQLWHDTLMPQINLALRSFYRKHHLESVEISLEAIGESAEKTVPTVLVVCTSVARVRSILLKKLGVLFDGTASTGLALKVCRGSMQRSRKGAGTTTTTITTATRCMARSEPGSESDDDDDEPAAANPGYQERPLSGASIGAWIGDRHLPPVSFGGLIIVDGEPYGMTVHHMLDDPDEDDAAFGDSAAAPPLRRSSAPFSVYPDTSTQSFHPDWFPPIESSISPSEEYYAYEFSDDEDDDGDDDDSDSVIDCDDDDDSEDEGDEEDDQYYAEDGDVPGIEPGCGEGYLVTQPALDDVEAGFYSDADSTDAAHLDAFRLGAVYASSGIRRRHEPDSGIVHEIDWALFAFEPNRLPETNAVPSLPFPPVASSPSPPSSWAKQGPQASVLQSVRSPVAVTPAAQLPGLEVLCSARTSGLQTGRISPVLTSVKLPGRTSPSQTYQVSGGGGGGASSPSSHFASYFPPIPNAATPHPDAKPPSPPSLPLPTAAQHALGIPGDSGAWVLDRRGGALCGHVLAWSAVKRVAYICPMDVLLRDIAETLGAVDVRLPGGGPIPGVVAAAHADPGEQWRGEEAAVIADCDPRLGDFKALRTEMRRLELKVAS